jgi:hypothetical protein
LAWIGKWLFAVGVIHSSFGFVFMRGTIAVLWSERMWNTVNGQPRREAVFWFLLTGFLLLIVGVLIDVLEKRRLVIPRFVVWCFAFLAVLGAAVMPISGIWLLIPPVVGMFFQRSKYKSESHT